MSSLKAHSDDLDRAFDEAVGARIKSVRLASGLTQTAVANATGVSFQQLQKYERGDNRVAASRLARIAAGLGVTGGHLLGEDGEAAPAPTVTGSMRLVSDFNRCPPVTQKIILDLVRAMAPSKA